MFLLDKKLLKYLNSELFRYICLILQGISSILAHDDTWLGIGYFSTLHSGREILVFNARDRVHTFITDLQDGPVADLIVKVGIFFLIISKS